MSEWMVCILDLQMHWHWHGVHVFLHRVRAVVAAGVAVGAVADALLAWLVGGTCFLKLEVFDFCRWFDMMV